MFLKASLKKVIVGGYDDEGNADPSMITFVYKTGFEDKKKGDDYKPPRRNSKSKKLSSQPNDDSSKLSQQATDVARRDGCPSLSESRTGRSTYRGEL